MAEQASELHVGRLTVTIPDGVRRCGIHGNDTSSGRCASCDLGPVTTIIAEVVLPWSTTCRRTCSSEAEAFAFAAEQVGPNQPQVTMVAHTPDLLTWANRHVCWEAGEVRDSGWRLYVAGVFVGGGELRDLVEGVKRCERPGCGRQVTHRSGWGNGSAERPTLECCVPHTNEREHEGAWSRGIR